MKLENLWRVKEKEMMIRWLIETLSNRKYNKELERMGVVDRNEIRLTAVGWKPDETYTEDKDIETASKNKEYYKVIRNR